MNSMGIKLKNVSKEYVSYQGNKVLALNNVNLAIRPGEFVGITGMNGSGKTTLARLFNGLVTPTSGKVIINGMDTCERNKTMEIRRRVAMVFQNPDNQIVCPVVEEEIAFGPQNLELPGEEVDRRVNEVIEILGLQDLRQHSPHLLSGGEKQRVAIASSLAMYPDYLVLDEPTAMLDQLCRRELIAYLHELNQKKGITVILISHNMEDMTLADRVMVLKEGTIAADAAPWEIFNQDDKASGLKSPDIIAVVQILREQGCYLDKKITTREELVNRLCLLSKSAI